MLTLDPALGPREVAAALSVTPQRLWRLRTAKVFPGPDLVLPGRSGQSPRWRLSTVQAWLDEQQQAASRRPKEA